MTTDEDKLRVLVLARSYPNNVLPELGLWVERPTVHLARACEITVISPVPYFPPVPRVARLRSYTRFRSVARSEVRAGVAVQRPRFFVGPGDTLYRFEATTFELSATLPALRAHRRRPFDLVHAHFVYPDGVVGHRIARRMGVPFVLTEHAPWVPWLERPGIAGPALEAARAASRILAVSSSVRATIVDYIGESDRIEVVPLCVDETIFGRDQSVRRLPDEILYVGQINRTKGVDVLLRAMRLLVDRGTQARLTLVGGTYYHRKRREEEELRRLAADLGLGERLRFLGMLAPAEVAARMQSSSVVVLPSRAESFGSVLIESLACGTPVVATRSGGPEDIVGDAQGMLVPVGNESALAGALADVLANPHRYPPDELAADAVSRYGAETVVARTLDVYRSAVAAPRPATVA